MATNEVGPFTLSAFVNLASRRFMSYGGEDTWIQNDTPAYCSEQLVIREIWSKLSPTQIFELVTGDILAFGYSLGQLLQFTIGPSQDELDSCSLSITDWICIKQLAGNFSWPTKEESRAFRERILQDGDVAREIYSQARNLVGKAMLDDPEVKAEATRRHSAWRAACDTAQRTASWG